MRETKNKQTKKPIKTRFQDNLSFSSNKVHMQSDFGETKLFD